MDRKLGLVSISFRGHTPGEILEAMKKSGLQFIEWGSDVHAPPERAAQIAALTRDAGIQCCSYGTYFRLGANPIGELNSYITAAKTLGTNILRLWCGGKNSDDFTPEEKAELFETCRAAAKVAEESGVVLCMECHNNTFTNRKEAALELMQAVNAPHFQMYWQPNQFRTEAENLAYATLLAPYTQVVHVFNWEARARLPLKEAAQVWKKYLSCFPREVPCLLEFVPDDKLETLGKEARALQEIVYGTDFCV